MDQAVIDNLIRLISLLTALLVLRFSKNRMTGIISSFFLLFAPLVIFYNMWAHTLAVLIVYYKKYLLGNFQYTFHFYSLVFFGVIFILLSGYNISCALKSIKGDLSQKRKIHMLNFATALLFIPMVFINPIASLPVIASIVSSISLRVARPVNRESRLKVQLSGEI